MKRTASLKTAAFAIILAASASASFAATASAAEPGNFRQSVRNFFQPSSVSNFDLNTVDGVARAHRRIVTDANQTCSGVRNGVKAPGSAFQSCVAANVSGSIASSGSDALQSFHDALNENDQYRAFKPAPAGWTVPA